MDCTSADNANSSIDGIGVRVASYVNTFFCLFTILIVALAGHCNRPRVFKEAERDMQMYAARVFVSGFGLLFACLVVYLHTKTAVSLYDAIIVLYVSWLNSLTAGFSTLLRALIERPNAPHPVPFWIRKVGLYEFYLISTGVFGFILFWDVGRWTAPGCAYQYEMVLVLGQVTVQPTNPILRGVILTISVLSLAPLLNICIPYQLLKALASLEWSIRGCTPGRTPWFALAIWAIPTGLVIAAIEQFVYANSAILGSQRIDYDITFGQILAFFPAVFSLWDAFDRINTLLGGQDPLEEIYPLDAVPRPKNGTPNSSRFNSYYSNSSQPSYSQVPHNMT